MTPEIIKTSYPKFKGFTKFNKVVRILKRVYKEYKRFEDVSYHSFKEAFDEIMCDNEEEYREGRRGHYYSKVPRATIIDLLLAKRKLNPNQPLTYYYLNDRLLNERLLNEYEMDIWNKKLSEMNTCDNVGIFYEKMLERDKQVDVISQLNDDVIGEILSYL